MSLLHARGGPTGRRRLTMVGAGVLVVVVLAGAWFGWLAWHVYHDLDAASDDAATLQHALSTGDEQTSRQALARFERHSDSARDRTGGASWSLLTHLPVVGDDARGVQVASSVLADLADNGVKPIVNSATALQSLAPKDGKVPLDTVVSLQGPVASAQSAFRTADERLAREDTSGYTPRLRRLYRGLAGRIDDASHSLDAANTAVQLMPDMLGAHGVRRYLLVFQNNAEIRSTGGLPGSVSLIEARNGQVTMRRQVTGASFGETAEPVLPLSQSEQQIYGRQLGTYFLDANFTPDFPRVADLMRAHWKRRFGADVDGVFVVDPVALSYVLGATGPVDIGQTQPLTAANAVQGLLNTAYAVFPDEARQDAFFEEVARQVFAAFTEGQGSPASLLQAVARGVEEHRILMHAFDGNEQSQVAGTQIAGELVTDPKDSSPQVGVYLDDNTGAKMSYYLRTEVSVDATFCKGQTQGLSGEATLESVAPPDAGTTLPATITGGGAYGIAAGSQLVALRLYAPAGGSVSDIEFDRKPVKDVDVVVQDGRPVATTYVMLDPGQQVRVTWSMVTGDGQTGDVDVDVTPGVAAVDTSSVEPSSC